VACDYLNEAYDIYGYIKQHWAFEEIPGKFEDYILAPKSGYRALHTIVRVRTSFGEAKCEVQIRTALQDAWAIKSHALVYKLQKTDLERLPLPLRNLLVYQSDLLYTLDQGAHEVARMIRRYLASKRKRK
jgi:ppGpp synthetase/RelA/SpoT-type nucleotidyltranferase